MILRLSLLALAGLIIGALYDSWLLGLVVTLLIALCWQLVWLFRLDRWIHGEKLDYLPEGSGVWPGVFARIDYLRGRSKQRNKNYKALLRQMRQAAGAFPDGAVILSGAHEIIYMNRVAKAMLGLKRKQDRGLRIENLIRDPDLAAYMQQESHAKAVEIASPLNHGSWLSCHLVPYGLDQKLLLIRDITTQVKAEAMRRDFVANASHELRTPLTVVAGYLDVLSEDDSLSADLRVPVSEMQRQTDRMRTLVQELLRLSELESKGPVTNGKTVVIAALMAAASQEARAFESCPEVIEVRVDSDEDLCGDESDIQSVLTNLVSNAARYTPVDGRITISWSTDEKGGYLEVADTGAGIAGEHLSRLTERFYRVEGGRERIGGEGGTGLGLAIVKHALQRYSATLEVTSEPGVGSRFVCQFPRSCLVTSGGEQ